MLYRTKYGSDESSGNIHKTPNKNSNPFKNKNTQIWFAYSSETIVKCHKKIF